MSFIHFAIYYVTILNYFEKNMLLRTDQDDSIAPKIFRKAVNVLEKAFNFFCYLVLFYFIPCLQYYWAWSVKVKYLK